MITISKPCTALTRRARTWPGALDALKKLMATSPVIEAVGQPSPAPAASPPKKLSLGQHWKLLLVLALACVGCVTAMFVFFSHRVSTDDAQVDSHISSVSPRISGYVDKILVDDNQKVAAGELLARIDPRDYQAEVEESHRRARSGHCPGPIGPRVRAAHK